MMVRTHPTAIPHSYHGQVFVCWHGDSLSCDLLMGLPFTFAYMQSQCLLRLHHSRDLQLDDLWAARVRRRRGRRCSAGRRRESCSKTDGRSNEQNMIQLKALSPHIALPPTMLPKNPTRQNGDP
jgi:hypothetical protein